MDSFELNKVAGAVLGALLFAFGTGFLAELIYTPMPAGDAGYALPGGGEGGEHGAAAAAGGGEAAAPASMATRLAGADVEKGKSGTKACQACHSFEKGGPNKMGPDLWEVIGRKKASHEGFGYSDGMKAKGGDWSYDDLDHFLTKPSEYVKGTKMAFQGISNAQERANVIAYLHTLADDPKPLPAADKDEGKKDEGKAEDGKKDAAKPAEGGEKADAAKKDSDKKDAGTKTDAKAPDAKPADGEKKPESKPADAKPADAKAPDAKASEKPAEKQAEPEKASEQPAAKSESDTDAKPADSKPADGDTKADAAKPAGDAGKPAAEKPADAKPADEKPAQP